MSKKLTIAIFLPLFIVGAMFLAIPSVIDKESITSQITASFKSLTGLNLEVQGVTTITAFPLPHITINSLYIQNAANASAPFFLKVRELDIWPTFDSLFKKNIAIRAIKISGIDVELERMKNEDVNWKDDSVFSSSNFKPGEPLGSIFNSTLITIDDTLVRYVDSVSQSTSTYDDINAELSVNESRQEDSQLHMQFTYENRSFDLAGSIGSISKALTSGNVPASLKIASGKSSAGFKGTFGYDGKQLLSKGNIQIETNDVVPWLSLLLGNTDKPPPAAAEYKPLPLKASSELDAQGNKIIFPVITLEGAVIKGTAHTEIDLPNQVQLTTAITQFDLEALFASKLFDIKGASGGENPKEDLFNMKTSQAPITVNADLKFADILYNQHHITDAHATFDMVGNEMTVPQVTASLPGESHLVFAGIGKQGYHGFTLEGQIDAAGNDFYEAAQLFKSKGFFLPAEDFKRFRLKTNTVLSVRDIRFSELAARIENIGIVGAVIATFSERTQIESALRVTGLNMDHFLKLWGLQDWRASLQENAAAASHNDTLITHWLRSLDYNLKLSGSFDQYILNGIPRDGTTFHLLATAGKLDFKDIKTSYNGTNLDGEFTLDLNGDLPKIDITAHADALDTATFFTADGRPAPPPPPSHDRWSRTGFDFHWLELLNATYHLKFDRFRNSEFQADKLELQGNIDDRNLTVEKVAGDSMGAHFTGKFGITGGKIPGGNISLDVLSLNVEQLAAIFPILHGMTGKYNLSIHLDTSGIDMYSWASNLEGGVGIGGTDVLIRGFNLNGIIRAVSYVRTVADILNVVKRAFPGGDTLFSGVEGQWTVAGGVFKTGNARLKNEQASGMLANEIDIVNWKVQCRILFYLRTLDPARPPSIIISFAGDLDNPESAIDTRSLEEYVTNKTSEKMLQQYGTHEDQ